MGRAAMNNRSNQMNPNNMAYWSSRGTSMPGAGGGGSGGGFGGVFDVGEQVTIWFADGFWRRLYAPRASVAAAVIGKSEEAEDGIHGVLEVTPESPAKVVFARRTPDESGGQAVERARKQFPGLHWVPLSYAHSGSGGGVTPRYWWIKLRAETDGAIALEDGGGSETLDGLVPGLVSDKGPQPPSGMARGPAPSCPDCKEPMVEGYIPSAAFIHSQADTRWRQGLESETSLRHYSPGVLMDDHESLHVRSYRCPKCGLLREYAFGHKDWEAWAFKGWK